MVENSMIKEMKVIAMKASRNAYCPYSKFSVGAAVLTKDGKLFSGCNVENASFGLTICAERNAIFGAVAQGLKDIVAVVIFTPTEHAAAPCGACRQVISEFNPRAEVYSFCNSKDYLYYNIKDLLPNSFTSDFL